jgi:ribonuclease HI
MDTQGKPNRCIREVNTKEAIAIPVKKTKNSSKLYNPIIGNLPRVQVSPNSIRQIHNWSHISPETTDIPQIIIDNTEIGTTNTTDLEELRLHHKIREKLEEIKRTIQDWRTVEIYTDGSLDKYANRQVKMGIGGIIIDQETQAQVEFKGRCAGFPSSTRAELVAILTALAITNTNTKVTIYTDSQSAIHAIQSKLPRKQRLAKATNLLTTTLIMDKIQFRKATTEFRKIKAHTGNINNERADALAKEGRELGYEWTVEIESQHIKSLFCTLQWNKENLDIGTSGFMKYWQNSKWISTWATQRRHKAWLRTGDEKEIDWKRTWASLSPSKITSFETHQQDHNIRAFRYKLLNEELPTKDKLYKRKPDLYKDDKCPWCDQQENVEHIYREHHAKQVRSKFLKVLKEEISSRMETKENKFNWQSQLEEIITDSERSLRYIIKGIFSKDLISLIERANGTKTKDTIKKVTGRMTKTLQKIWIQRCERFQQWEKSANISRTDKRSKNRGHSHNNRSTTQYNQQGVVDKQVEISNMQRKLVSNWLDQGENIINFNFIYSYNNNTDGALAR